MNSQYKKVLQWMGTGVGAVLTGIALMLSTTIIAYPAISSIAGLAVAQTSTLWNNVKDAAAGDGLSSGILAQSTMLYNGVSFDRMKSVPASDANAATGVAANSPLVYNGATYDRIRGGLTTDTNAATGLLDTALMIFNGTTWDRVRGTGGSINVTPAVAGTSSYSIDRANITTASVNLAFGFTSKKVKVIASPNNTADVCIDWLGGTAVCPAANTAGDDRLKAGTALILDSYAVTSLSVIADSGTQEVQVAAWN